MNVMIDLETTGVESGCCILSVAVVPFLAEAPLEPFYEKISHVKSMDAGFTNNEDTLKWWDKQRKDIQDEAFSGTRSPESVMESLTHYFKLLGEPKDIFVWGNGADFDNVILGAYFKKLGMKQPWGIWNNRCYRTLKNLFPVVQYQKPVDAHNALADAAAQARHAALISQAVQRGFTGFFAK